MIRKASPFYRLLNDCVGWRLEISYIFALSLFILGKVYNVSTEKNNTIL